MYTEFLYPPKNRWNTNNSQYRIKEYTESNWRKLVVDYVKAHDEQKDDNNKYRMGIWKENQYLLIQKFIEIRNTLLMLI